MTYAHRGCKQHGANMVIPQAVRPLDKDLLITFERKVRFSWSLYGWKEDKKLKKTTRAKCSNSFPVTTVLSKHSQHEH